MFSTLSSRVGSGQQFFESQASGRVKSFPHDGSGRVGSGLAKICFNPTGRVRPDQEEMKSSRVTSQVTTREKWVTRGWGQHDPRVVFW